MILYPDGDGALLLTTQTDHAFFSAELLSLWREDGLPEHPRRREVLFAVREHDNGWREADAAPRVHPESRRPHDFLSIPDEVRFEIWRRGMARFRDERPYAGLLIALHARELHAHHRGEDSWAEFLEEIDTVCVELLETSGMEEEEALREYRFLELTDLISLAVCTRWNREFDLHGYRFHCREDNLVLDPFPLAGATTFEVRCRRIPDRAYSGEVDLGGELAMARWEKRRVRVRPAASAASR